MYVSIVDYGTGNLNSVSKALEVAAEQISKKINIKISNKPKDILDSDKIILPGQGSYRQCALGVKNIKGLARALRLAMEKDSRAGDSLPSTKGIL